MAQVAIGGKLSTDISLEKFGRSLFRDLIFFGKVIENDYHRSSLLDKRHHSVDHYKSDPNCFSYLCMSLFRKY